MPTKVLLVNTLEQTVQEAREMSSVHRAARAMPRHSRIPST